MMNQIQACEFGLKRWKKVQITATISEKHAKIIRKILNNEHNKPIAHDNVSEVIRKAIEHYAEFLGIKLEGG